MRSWLLNKKIRVGILATLALVAIGALYLAAGPRFGGEKLQEILKPDNQISQNSDDVTLPDVNPDINQFGLEIPFLNIKVPVIADVDGANEKLYHRITAKLGVAHLKGTPKPDEKGNVYLFGHSSFWENYPGEYKELFRPLDQLKKGETFTVFYKDVPYQYKVTTNKIVAEDDFSVLDPTPNNPDDFTITIQTSWPPGTAAKRLVVLATRI